MARVHWVVNPPPHIQLCDFMQVMQEHILMNFTSQPRKSLHDKSDLKIQLLNFSVFKLLKSYIDRILYVLFFSPVENVTCWPIIS